MSGVRPAGIALLALALSAATASAQSQNEAEPEWELSATVFTYFLPDEGNYAQPTFTADRDALHLEFRYNYEALNTGSAWVGYNLGGGDRVEWEVTPMLGGVFGETNGVAPGYTASIAWWKLDAYSEGEYLFATEREERFGYNWSEVAIAPLEWLRVGMVTQRTRAYESDREIQRGPFANVTIGRLDTAVYVFNPDDSDPTIALSIGVSF
jgi:hypothetical protein